MLRLDYRQLPEYREWLECQLSIDLNPCTTIAVLGDKLLAVGAYNRYTKSSIEITLVAKGNWCNRTILKAAFSYPFEDLKVNRISLTTREDNEKAIKLANKLGFKQEGIMREYYADRTNAILFGMLKHECRWI